MLFLSFSQIHKVVAFTFVHVIIPEVDKFCDVPSKYYHKNLNLKVYLVLVKERLETGLCITKKEEKLLASDSEELSSRYHSLKLQAASLREQLYEVLLYYWLGNFFAHVNM